MKASSIWIATIYIFVTFDFSICFRPLKLQKYDNFHLQIHVDHFYLSKDGLPPIEGERKGDREDNEPPLTDQERAVKDLEDLLSKYENIDYDEIPDEERKIISDLVQRAGPSELQKRLQILGFNPLTYAGFALAAVLITLNTLLGTGWLGDAIGINISVDNTPPLNIIEDNSLKFDYDKYLEYKSNLKD